MSPTAGRRMAFEPRGATTKVDRDAAHSLVERPLAERLWVGLAFASLVAVWTGVSLAFVAALLYVVPELPG